MRLVLGTTVFGDSVPAFQVIEAIKSAAGPLAEARIRHCKIFACLTGPDFEVAHIAAKAGALNFADCIRETSWIVRRSWPDILKLAEELRQARSMTLPEVSAQLAWPDSVTPLYSRLDRTIAERS
jgi:hypothetical protein